MSREIAAAEHPGKVLRKEFLQPMGVSQSALARHMGVGPHVINELVSGKRRVSALMALRLGRALGTTPGFWLEMQVDYDLVKLAKTAEGRRILNTTPSLWDELRRQGNGFTATR